MSKHLGTQERKGGKKQTKKTTPFYQVETLNTDLTQAGWPSALANIITTKLKALSNSEGWMHALSAFQKPSYACWLTFVFIEVTVGYGALPHFEVPLLHHNLPARFHVPGHCPRSCV